jgi:hypothetical protein
MPKLFPRQAPLNPLPFSLLNKEHNHVFHETARNA